MSKSAATYYTPRVAAILCEVSHTTIRQRLAALKAAGYIFPQLISGNGKSADLISEASLTLLAQPVGNGAAFLSDLSGKTS